MKKLFTLAFAALIAAGASAQTVQESKTFDNIYVGVNGGLATKTTGHAWMKGLDPNFGVRVGRWFTPVHVNRIRDLYEWMRTRSDIFF